MSTYVLLKIMDEKEITICSVHEKWEPARDGLNELLRMFANANHVVRRHDWNEHTVEAIHAPYTKYHFKLLRMEAPRQEIDFWKLRK